MQMRFKANGSRGAVLVSELVAATARVLESMPSMTFGASLYHVVRSENGTNKTKTTWRNSHVRFFPKMRVVLKLHLGNFVTRHILFRSCLMEISEPRTCLQTASEVPTLPMGNFGSKYVMFRSCL